MVLITLIYIYIYRYDNFDESDPEVSDVKQPSDLNPNNPSSAHTSRPGSALPTQTNSNNPNKFAFIDNSLVGGEGSENGGGLDLVNAGPDGKLLKDNVLPPPAELKLSQQQRAAPLLKVFGSEAVKHIFSRYICIYTYI